jgi:hypothetical protein
MKKLSFLLTLMVLFSVAATAQEYKKFRWANGLGYAKPAGDGGSGGVLWATELGYRVSDPICVSLKIEGAVMVRGLSESATEYDAEAKAVASYTVNGIYYFSNEKFRPYVGAGMGMYSLAGVASSTSSGGVAASASQSKIGFYPRIGFDLGHFNINIDYNILGDSDIMVSNGTTEMKMKNSYLGVRIGGFFFGGRN